MVEYYCMVKVPVSYAEKVGKNANLTVEGETVAVAGKIVSATAMVDTATGGTKAVVVDRVVLEAHVDV